MTEQKRVYIEDALSEVEDMFIEEAVSYENKKPHRGIGKKEFAAFGAFAAVLVVCVTTYMQLPTRESSESTAAMSGAEGAMPESAIEEQFKEDSIREEGIIEESTMEADTSLDEEAVGAQNPIGVTAKATDVTAAGMTLVLSQEGGHVSGTLLTGAAYWLEQYIDGEWVRLERRYEVIKELAYELEPDSTAVLQIDWEGMYGVLESGIYRLGKQIDDLREAGEFDSYEVYVEFSIIEE